MSTSPAGAGAPIWSFSRSVSIRLLAWGLASVAAGLLIARSRAPFRRALGWQSAGWGAIDSLIAVFGLWSAARKQKRATPEDAAAQARSLRKLLLLNTALDVGYVAGGGALAAASRPRSANRGHGLAIVVQGLFLFVFDLFHALRVPQDPTAGAGRR